MNGQDCLLKIRLGGNERRDGISQLYREYSAPFLRYFLKHRVRRELAEEMVQDVFVNITRSCDSFRQEDRFDVWLWKIARNRLMDHYRRRLPEIELEEDMLDALSQERDDLQVGHENDGGLADCVRRSFQSFATDHPSHAEALSLLSFHEWTVEEMASFLGRTHGATREYLSQCRKRLRPYIEICREYIKP